MATINPKTGKPYETLGGSSAMLAPPRSGSDSDLYAQYGAYPAANGGESGMLGTAGGATTSAGMATANPFVVGAGLAMQAGQMGLDIYGNYKEQQRQEQAMREQKAEMERRRRIEEEDRKYQRYLNRLAQAQNIGQYSQGLEDRSLDRYSKYVS